MASVEPHGPRLRVVWRIPGQTHKQYLTCADPASATRAAAIAQAHGHAITARQVYDALSDHIPTAAQPGSVHDWVLRYIDTLSISDRTAHEYRQQADTYLSDLTMSVDEIDNETVKLWVKHVAATRAAKTVSNVHGLLSAAMAAAVIAGKRQTNPCAGIRLPSRHDEAGDEMCFLTHDEYTAVETPLIEWARSFTRTAVRTGLRYGEITALEPRHFDLTGKVPKVRVEQAWKRRGDGGYILGGPKTRRSRRTIALDAATVEAVAPLLTGRFVFVAPHARGERLPHTTFYRHWQAAIAAAQNSGDLAKTPRFHDLRHTHVAWLAEAGVPIHKVSARLGHESIRTTWDVYGHLFPDYDDQIVAALDGMG